MVWGIVIVIFLIGSVVAFCFWLDDKNRKPTSPEKETENTYKYGHRFNPVLAVKNRLPSLSDTGHVWELTVVDGSNNRLYLKLSILRLVDSTVIASRSFDMTHYKGHDKSFQQHYIEFGQYGIAKESAWKQIVTASIDWAFAKRRELKNQGEYERHMIA